MLAKLYAGLKNPDFNYTIRIAPSECCGARYFHWYVSIIPRMTGVAGFELGSGMFINTVLPETAAEFRRPDAQVGADAPHPLLERRTMQPHSGARVQPTAQAVVYRQN